MNDQAQMQRNRAQWIAEQQAKVSAATDSKTCKSCSMSIPKSAKVCPYCRKKQGTSMVSILIAFVFLIFITPIVTSQMGMFGLGSSIHTNTQATEPKPQPTAQQIAAQKEAAEHDEAQEHVKSFILKSLKAPSTAKFPGYDEIPAVKKDGYWESYTYVDAQNSFGAMIRTRYYVKMENQGDVWRLVDISTY